MTGQSPFEKVYATDDPSEFEDIYDEWARDYDADLDAAGYATPDRLANLLAPLMPAPDAPILDFACGTGLSGLALRRAGLSVIDGVDISQKMLDVAEETGVYRSLTKITPEAPLPTGYPVIAAVGAISKGAAPPDALDAVADALAPGGLLALSYNEQTLKDPAYAGKLDTLVADGTFEPLVGEHGPHLPELNLSSTVYILKRR